MPEDVATTISELITGREYQVAVLASTRDGREISARLAAKLKAGYVDSVVGIDKSNSDLSFKRISLFQHADYGIIGDLYEVVPEITSQLRNKQLH